MDRSIIVMKEIGPIAETGHTAEIGHIVEIGFEATTTKLTKEMSIEVTIRRKIIGISRIRDIRKGIKTNIKTHMTRVTIEIITKIKTEAETDIEVTAMI